MTSKELVDNFNLTKDIDFNDLSSRISEYLKSDSQEKVVTIMELLETVIELNWELYQYNELQQSKTYSELYKMIISTYALNPKLGKIPTELTQLDIKLRRESDTEKIISIIDRTFIPIILSLLLKFNLDMTLIKMIDVIMVTRKVCIKYHKKIKLTLDTDKFNKLKLKFRNEIAYFGFTGCFTEDQLKTEYRKRAKELHPDKGGDPKEFIKLKEYFDRLNTIFN